MQYKDFANVQVMDHPLIKHKISLLRKVETGTYEFRQLVEEIAMLMTFESTRDLALEDVEIETPICKTTVKMLKGEDVAIVPILRAGLGMVEGIQKIIPNAKVGHVGLYRDPVTHEPHEYYCKMPDDIDKRKIELDSDIKTFGTYGAKIKIYTGVNADIKVVVTESNS